MSDDSEKCSVARLGDLLDLSLRRIQQLAKEGVIPKDVRGEYDVAASVRGYGRYLQEQASRAVGDPDLLEANRHHEILNVQMRRARIDKLKSNLIDREQATTLVNRLARRGRASWATWPSRVAPEMAADFGIKVSAMQARLEHHVLEHLSEMREVKPQFRSHGWRLRAYSVEKLALDRGAWC